jgi:hypothetical protein
MARELELRAKARAERLLEEARLPANVDAAIEALKQTLLESFDLPSIKDSLAAQDAAIAELHEAIRKLELQFESKASVAPAVTLDLEGFSLDDAAGATAAAVADFSERFPPAAPKYQKGKR